MLAAAARRLWSSRGFTLFAIATLAGGIGTTSAFYATVGVLLSPPLAVADPATLVTVGGTSPLGRVGAARLSWPDIEDIAAQAQSVERVTGYAEFRSALVRDGSSELTSIIAVSGEYFPLLGVRTVAGRPIQPADDRADSEPVGVLSYFVWMSQFGGQPDVIGTIVKIAGRSVRVVGIAPREFRGVGGDRLGQRIAWVPLSFTAALDGRSYRLLDMTRRSSRSFRLIARLAPGASKERASSEMAVIGARLDEQGALATKRGWRILSAEEANQSTEDSEVVWIILALPVLVMIVVCTNLANLVISRGVARKHELAIRSSLGASRLRLVLEELVEPSILAICGGALSIVVATVVLNWVASVLNAPLASLTGGLVFEWRIDPKVWGIAGAATLFAVVTLGVLPAMQLTGHRQKPLNASDSFLAGQRWRGRRNVIALQVFVSVSLSLLTLVGYAYVAKLVSVNPDQPTDMEDLVVAHIPYDGQQYSRLAAEQSISSIETELRSTFGAGAVALASYPPFVVPWLPWVDARAFFASATVTPDATTAREALIHSVAGDYFRALSYQAVSGRFFDERDSLESDPVVILSEHLARDVYGAAPAVGRVIYWNQIQAGVEVDSSGSATVVGVVRGWEGGGRVAYMPFDQRYQPTLAVLARVDSLGVNSLVNRLKTSISRADPNVAVQVVGRADSVAGGPRLVASFVVKAVGVLTATLLALSMSGLYGVLSQVVTQRRREMGLRMALGASSGGIVRLILRNGMAPVLEGCLIGTGVAVVLRQLLQTGFRNELSGVTPWMFLAVVLPLVLIALATCYFPARRAAKADPNVVLRDL